MTFRNTDQSSIPSGAVLRPDFMVPFDDAVAELERRQHDPILRARVEEYLDGDIPKYLKQGPALLLMRYVATPNHEALRFLSLAHKTGIRAVISEDHKDFFSVHTTIKRNLCKLPIIRRITENETGRHEHLEYISISDCAVRGKWRLSQMVTKWGESLTTFHTRLFHLFAPKPYELVSDTAWVDRQYRGELFEHYKRYLALVVVHGVLCEDYLLDDKEEVEFLENVVRPAYEFITHTFGVPPLIAELTPPGVESEMYWNGYPAQVREMVRAELAYLKAPWYRRYPHSLLCYLRSIFENF